MKKMAKTALYIGRKQMTEGISKEPAKSSHNKINNVGKRFGRLLVIASYESYVTRTGKKKSMWQCKCDCGNDVCVMGTNLMSGHTKSCGCLNKDIVSKTKSKHRLCNDPSYSIWKGILSRCTNPKSTGFKHYGGRGVAVCERLVKFENFYSDMGTKPDGMSVERIDNNKGYSPDNCVWATHQDQCRNRRSSNIIEFDGQKKCLTEWAGIIGVHRSTLIERLKKLPVDIAFTMKSRHPNRCA